MPPRPAVAAPSLPARPGAPRVQAVPPRGVPAVAAPQNRTGVPAGRYDPRPPLRSVPTNPSAPLARPTGMPGTVVARPAGTPRRSGLAVDRAGWAAWLDGELLDLTYLEFEMLDFLVSHPGRVYSRAALLRHVWGHQVDDDPGQAGRTVDVLVTRLRRKLGTNHRFRIETVRRVGYRYRPAADDMVS